MMPTFQFASREIAWLILESWHLYVSGGTGPVRFCTPFLTGLRAVRIGNSFDLQELLA